MPDVKYPHIEVQLLGTNGNAFVLLAKVQEAMRKAGVSQKEIDAVMEEARKSDYDHLLQTLVKTVVVT